MVVQRAPGGCRILLGERILHNNKRSADADSGQDRCTGVVETQQTANSDVVLLQHGGGYSVAQPSSIRIAQNKKGKPLSEAFPLSRTHACTRGGTRTHTILLSTVFETVASTNSATRAGDRKNTGRAPRNQSRPAQAARSPEPERSPNRPSEYILTPEHKNGSLAAKPHAHN